MQTRHQRLVKYIENFHQATVQELAEIEQVSLETIRRDLNQLAKQNLLHRTHGGAVSPKHRDIGRSFQERRNQNSEAKKSIAEKALDFFFEGAVIGLDASSSSWNFAQRLPDVRCTVITSSMHNIRALTHKQQIEIVATGGVYSGKYDAFYGSHSTHLFSRFQLDIAICSCTGIADGIVWESNEMNAVMKRKMLAASKHAFLFADHTKFGRKDLIQLCDLSDLDKLFTNITPPTDIQTFCQKNGVEIVM